MRQRIIGELESIGSVRAGVYEAERMAALAANRASAPAEASVPARVLTDGSAAWEGRAIAQAMLGVEVTPPPVGVSVESLAAVARVAFSGVEAA